MEQVRHEVVCDEDGSKFQVQTEAMWDGHKQNDIRVMVAVSDGGLSDFVPTTSSFIISPDGSFVGDNDRG